MKPVFSLLRAYDEKFDEGLPFWGLTDEQFEWMLKEAEKAIKGERGPITFEGIQRAFGVEPKEGIDY